MVSSESTFYILHSTFLITAIHLTWSTLAPNWPKLAQLPAGQVDLAPQLQLPRCPPGWRRRQRCRWQCAEVGEVATATVQEELQLGEGPSDLGPEMWIIVDIWKKDEKKGTEKIQRVAGDCWSFERQQPKM